MELPSNCPKCGKKVELRESTCSGCGLSFPAFLKKYEYFVTAKKWVQGIGIYCFVIAVLELVISFLGIESRQAIIYAVVGGTHLIGSIILLCMSIFLRIKMNEII